MPTPAPARRARTLLPVALVLAAALVGACAEIGSDPNTVVSVEFNRLPSPAILIGDTLRTLEGEPALVRDSVKLFDQESDPIDDADVRSRIRFVATVDSARIRWDSTGGFLVSTATTGLRTVGVQAQVGGLYPPPVSLFIVPSAPTTLTKVDVDTAHAIAFGFFPTTVLTGTSEPLSVRLVAGDSLVTGWPVEFRVVSVPASIDSVRVIASAADTTRNSTGHPVTRESVPASIDSVRVIASAADTLRTSRPSPYDTTASSDASRLLAAWRKAGTPIGAADTVVVRARFRVRRELRDSVEWRIPVVQLAAPTLRR